MRLLRAITALAALVAVTACEKHAVQDITGPSPNAWIRFFNFGVNAPVVHFYSGTQKLTAASSTSCQAAANPPVTATDSLCHTVGIEAAAGIAYGGVTTNGNYVGIEPGQHSLIARIMTAADKGVALATSSTTIAPGKLYSYFVTGFYNSTTKQADAFIVEDDYPQSYDWTASYVRFINAVPNSQPMTLYLTDIVSGTSIPVGGAVAYKSAGVFVKVPSTGYHLSTRYTGSTDTRILRQNIGFQPGAIHTITARGDMTVTGSATNSPFLDNTINR